MAIPKTKAELEALVLAAVQATPAGAAIVSVVVESDDTGSGWYVRGVLPGGNEIHLTMVEGIATRLRRLYSLRREIGGLPLRARPR